MTFKKTQATKLMIIENFIDHYTTLNHERDDMKADAEIYVDEDHVDEIAQAFPETAKPQGFQNWIETFYEIVDHLATSSHFSGSMANVAREQGGMMALHTLAQGLTDEFESAHNAEYADGWTEADFFETIDEWLKGKENENYKLVHGL